LEGGGGGGGYIDWLIFDVVWISKKGDIIGGVIGKSVVRYDIYGKDVLLANKMESNGERGRILLSEPLKLVL